MSRRALITGVSRRAGIGFAIARRFLEVEMRVMVHGWAPHDAEQPWGGEPLSDVIDALGGQSPQLAYLEGDLADENEPERAVAATVERFGGIDVLIATHARSSSQRLAEVSAAELDRSWAVNARASVLLVKAFAQQHDDARPAGRIVLFTSGQHLAPMPDELPYAISKGAIHQMTKTLADELIDSGITVNAINPGPVDTGYASPAQRVRVAQMFPSGRWGDAAEVAEVVAWLSSESSAPVTGQVIDAESGFRRAPS